MPLTEVDLILSTSVAAALFLDFLLVTMVIPILPALLPHDPLRAGILFAAKPLCQMLFNPLFGASGLPHATMLRAGTLLGGACAFAQGLARGYRGLLAARALSGAASAGVMTGGMSLLLSSHAEGVRAQAVARALLGLTLGVSLGPVWGGVVFDASGSAAVPFCLTGAAFVLLAAHQWLALAPPPAADTPPPPPGSSRAAVFRVATSRNALTAACCMFVVSAQVGALEPAVAYALRREYGFSAWAQGVVWGAAVPAMHGVATAVVGALDARWRLPPGRWVWIGLALPAAGLPLVGLGGVAHALPRPVALALLVAGLALQGACLGCVVTMVQPLLASIADALGEPDIAPLLALSDSFQSLGFVVGPLLGAAASRHAALTEVTFLGLALASALLLPFVAALNGRLHNAAVDRYIEDEELLDASPRESGSVDFSRRSSVDDTTAAAEAGRAAVGR